MGVGLGHRDIRYDPKKKFSLEVYMSFVPYPDIDMDDFNDRIFWKKEFNKTRYLSEFQYGTPETMCKRGEFKMQNHQEFIRNFISAETPYNGSLLFHGTGVGKTCAAMGVSEGLRDYVHKNGKKIYVLSSKNIRPNFYKELYDSDREAVERDIHGIPGSYQCSGDRYYVDGYFKPESKARAIKELINEHYVFKGYGTFSNFVDVELGCVTYDDDGNMTGNFLPKHMKEPKMTMEDGSWVDVGDYFNNSVIIIDEAHGIAGKGLKQDEDEDDSTMDDDDSEQSEDAPKPKTKAKAKAKGTKGAKGAKKPKNISKRSLFRVLESIIKACRAKGGSVKLLLLTATPMKDKVRELADLLELLNLNDGRELPAGWKGTLFPKDIMTYDTLSDAFDQEQERLLMTVAKGYVSYVKGDNPVTFPKALLPHHDDIPDILYEPGKRLDPLRMNPIFAYQESDEPVDIQEDFNIKEPPEFRFNLVKCEMDPYQFVCYNELVGGRVPGAGRSSDTHPRMISNFAFPVVSGSETPYTIIEHGADLKDILKRDENRAAVHGNKGFAYAFKDHVDIVPSTKDHASPKKYTSYSINETLWRTCGFFMMIENAVAPEYPLSMFSKKLSQFVEFVNRSPGIAYAYSEFVQSGALIAALALEANGYVRYHVDLRKYIDGNGLPKPNCRTQLPEAFLFRYTAEQLNAMPKNYYRCSRCGQLYDQCVLIPGHKFNLATYILVTGSDGGIKEIAEATTDNQAGDKVKVVVGTKVTGQGVDFKWIRQIHIIDPWHNNTVIYQAIGRGIRHCSHADIAPDQRTVMIYKYSSTTDVSPIMTNDIDIYDDEQLDSLVTHTDPDYPEIVTTFNFTYRDLLTETVDEHMYHRVVRKDLIIKLIERVLKRIAVDCELNRIRNIFPSDEDYSRACDYMLCQYKCEDFKDPVEYIRRIRRDADGKYQYWYEHGGKMELREAGMSDDTVISELIDITDTDGRSNEDMWEHYAVDRMVVREDDYEEVMVDEPLGLSIDASTYDIYFSEPQIDKAVKIISRIFQKTQALRLRKIVYLVKKMDPLIEEKFVYIALDKIVGRPPYVKPMVLVDKFGRNGTIIVHNEFYIYQPLELKDPVIPMFYRARPLSIKNRFYNMNRLTAARVKKVVHKAADVDQEKITGLAERLSGEKRPIVTVADIVIFHTDLYKLLLPELQALLEHMVQLSNESNTQYVVEYCMQVGMVFFLPEPEPEDEDTIGSLLKECRSKRGKTYLVHLMQSTNKPNTQVRIFRQGKWKTGEINALPDGHALLQGVTNDYPSIMIPHTDLSLQYGITQRELLSPMNDDKDKVYLDKLGIYGMMATPAHRLQQPLFEESNILTILLSAVEAFKKEYPTHLTLAKCKFKVFDQNNLEEVLTKAGTVSQRGKIRGRVCSTFSRENDVYDLVRYMCLVVQENSEQLQVEDDIVGFMKSLGVNGRLSDGVFNPIKSSKDAACSALMRLLMLASYMGINDKKWFIGPIDTNIYRPSKK